MKIISTVCYVVLLFQILDCMSERNIKVITETGKALELQYRSYQFFNISELRPQIPDVKLKNIGPVDVNSVQQFLQSNTEIQRAQKILKAKNDSFLQKVEYYYYNKRYNLDQKIKQIPFCIISPFHNFFGSSNWQSYLNTLETQNYTNFQVVMTDDVSTDNSTERLIQMIGDKYPRLAKRVSIVRNRDYIQIVGNHDIAIRNHCKQDSIVVQVDGDDTLIGRQVLNALNKNYYKHPSVWTIYTNMIQLSNNSYHKFGNTMIPADIFNNNSYRTWDRWLTGQLRTYRRKLYVKIPIQYFFREYGKYHLYGGDIFNMVALVELAGKQHTMYIDEIVYFYINFVNECKRILSKIAQFYSRIKTPYRPLNNLNDNIRQLENYQPPKQILLKLNKAIKSGQNCSQKLRDKINDSEYMKNPIKIQ